MSNSRYVLTISNNPVIFDTECNRIVSNKEGSQTIVVQSYFISLGLEHNATEYIDLPNYPEVTTEELDYIDILYGSDVRDKLESMLC